MYHITPMALPRTKQLPQTEADHFERLVRSHQKWARRRAWLRFRAKVLGRQSRVPANRSDHSATWSSVILANSTSGTLKP